MYRVEDARVDVQSVLHVQWYPRKPRSDSDMHCRGSTGHGRAGVVARRGLRVHAKLGHQPATHIFIVQVAADTKLR